LAAVNDRGYNLSARLPAQSVNAIFGRFVPT
jgi:hypothetical protein